MQIYLSSLGLYAYIYIYTYTYIVYHLSVAILAQGCDPGYNQPGCGLRCPGRPKSETVSALVGRAVRIVSPTV